MRILYVAPEHVSGGFSLFAQGHRQRGNEARWVTFFRSAYQFGEDICFDLQGMPSEGWVRKLRRGFNRAHGTPDLPELKGNPPFWKPVDPLDALLYRLRDFWNTGRIAEVIQEYGLSDFDVYHFEQGIDPFRDGRWVKSLSKAGKPIISFYHGTDLRNRGVIRAVFDCTRLHLTSEIDLLHRIPGMKYLYLPIDTSKVVPPPKKPHDRIRIGHAARNRELKGSNWVIAAVQELSARYPVELVMIENVPHSQAMELKAGCDIFVDQMTDKGGWGYGMSSVESLAMGIPTLTRINPQVQAFLGDHPFVSATPDDIKSQLKRLITSPQLQEDFGRQGREWVVAHHDISAVMDRLYEYYGELGIV